MPRIYMHEKKAKYRFNYSAPPEELREQWLKEIQQARRKYSIQKWIDQRKFRKVSLGEIIRWIYDDLKAIVIWNIHILLQLRAYGKIIKQAHGLSYFQQWYRMIYLVFVVQTRAVRLRSDHLFDRNRWDRVHEFSFSYHEILNREKLGPGNNEELEILSNKLKFFEFSRLRKLNTPEILSVFEKGKISLPANGLFTLPKRNLFVKELTGGRGSGAKKFFFENGRYKDVDGCIYTETEVHNFLSEYSINKKSMIVQNALINHESWRKFTNGNLATCRIVTGISPYKQNEIVPFFASIRMPYGNYDGDNYSRGALAASVDIRTGRLSTAVTAIPKCKVPFYDVHPDTGHHIKGEILPFWKELVEFVQRFHLHFETLSIGWDVALTEKGFCMIEGNKTWGSDVIEAPSGNLICDSIYPDWFEGWRKRIKSNESCL